jgi:hypothetical protein
MIYDILFLVSDILLNEGDYITYVKLEQCCKTIYIQLNQNLYKYKIYMNTSLENIMRTLLDANYENATYNEVINALDKFEKIIKKLKPLNIDKFIEEYFEILKNIKFNLAYYTERTSNNSNKKQLLQYRNITFLSKLKSIEFVDDSRQLTKLFNDFIKGITYFQSENIYDINQPVYHRVGSCVKKGLPNRNCIQNTNNTIPDEIEKCYLERLIYDLMWLEILQLQQNKSHQDWLKNTQDAYLTCFPNCSITVEIDFNKRRLSNNNITASNKASVPTRMKVIYYDNGNIIRTEIYTKQYDNINKEYIYPVDCQKEIGLTKLRKSTWFEKNTKWINFGGRKK